MEYLRPNTTESGAQIDLKGKRKHINYDIIYLLRSKMIFLIQM